MVMAWSAPRSIPGTILSEAVHRRTAGHPVASNVHHSWRRGGPPGYARGRHRSVTRRSQGPCHASNGVGTMPRMPQRPFRLSDALLLVAATALGLALCRFVNAHSQVGWRDVWNAVRSRDAANLSLAELWVVAREVARSASPLLLAWSASVLVSRL